MSYLKLTNTDATFGENPVVLNAKGIITVYADNTNSSCFVITTASKGNQGAFPPSFKSIGVFTITGDTYANFAKQINSALTGNPGGGVLEVFTKGKIDNYVINQA